MSTRKVGNLIVDENGRLVVTHSPVIAEVHRMFVRKDAGVCPFCHTRVDPSSFVDALSRREFEISGLCQACQDTWFAEEE